MHQCTQMTQSLILKGKADFWGRYAVYVRWSEGQKRTFKKTSLLLTKEQFENFKKGEPGKDRDLYKRFLAAMDEQPGRKSKADLYAYIDQCLKQWTGEKAESTLRQMQGEKSKLQAFRESALLTDITPPFLLAYQAHCKALGNKGNTVWKSFKFMRLIVLKALREGLIEENPFRVFPMPKYKDPKKHFLSEEQIEKIHALLEQNIAQEIKFAATWFLIACYTGLRFGDCQAFNKAANIKNGRLTLYTEKTMAPVAMPVNEKLKDLFLRIDYRPLDVSNQWYNTVLKQVQALAEIPITLTSHVARHTFGTRAMSRKVPIEYIARMMGHSSIRTTAIYAKITGHDLDKEYKKLD
jgi:site-specific recombinase XerD